MFPYLLIIIAYKFVISKFQVTMESKIFKSIRGHPKLSFAGYTYRRSNVNLTSQNWRCDRQKCKGSAATPLEFRDGTEVRPLQPHNHGPAPEAVEAELAKDQMLDEAATSQVPPRRLLSETMIGMTQGAIIRMGTKHSMRQKIHRKRRKLEGGEAHPVALPKDTDFDIPNAFQTVNEGNVEVPFILFDSRRQLGEDDDDDSNAEEDGRIIIFATNTMTALLRESRTWMMDGTFKVVPSLFMQLFVIHAVKNETVYPCLYVLMPNKQEHTYKRLFEVVAREIGEPRTCVCDFEMAMHNAINHTWQEAEVQGCFFHFSQSIWRKTQEVGLAATYVQDEGIRTRVKSLVALAFVRPEEVAPTFDSMFDDLGDDPRLNELFGYFESTYVGRKPVRGPRRRPRYNTMVWSVRARTLQGIPRTNNKVEGFHRGLQAMFDGPKPTMWRFLSGLKKEHSLQYAALVQHEAGAEPPQQAKKWRDLNVRLNNLIRSNEAGSIGIADLIRGIAHNVDLPA
jgi:hypothetical protein